MISNICLEDLPKRKADHAICIDLKTNFVKINLDREKIKYVRRENGIEMQYRWKCICGIPIGYTVISYDEFEEIRQE